MAARRSTANGGNGSRPRDRRERIVAAAAELFHTRGFHATRLEDIGAAVGMTGPAVYRHFESKEALLGELLDRYTKRATSDMQIALTKGTPHEVLALLLRSVVTQAVEDGPLVAIAQSELAHLPAAKRRGVRRRFDAIIDRWVAGILAVRKDLDAEEARVVAIGIVAMVRAGARERVGSKEKLIERLTRMATAVITAR